MKNYTLLVLAAVLLLTSSCGTYKRLGYLQDMEPDIDYSMPLQPDVIIAKGDKLDIQVVCSTPELVAPFNIMNGVNMMPAESVGSEGMQVAESQSARDGYEVDRNGDILFPVLGRIHVEGMTLKQVKARVENLIIAKRYVKDPVALVKFLNFKFTILGEGKAGVYSVPDGRVNIFEALAMSGDMTELAARDQVMVVRTVENKRRVYNINLKTKDCYYSPAFFIQQNDMIYLKPKDNKVDGNATGTLTVLNTIFTGTSAIVSAIIWSTYLLNR